MTTKFNRLMLAAAIVALAPAPALAGERAPAAAAPAQDAKAGFEADRADILAMAGNYKVRFDMQESTAWRAGYTPLDRKISGGFESVRVIEDSGRRIVLQHLLVVDDGSGKSAIVKHWRQDWEYEPARVLVYSAPSTWTWETVPEALRKGRWSQTVWQVDDSPRYGGWGAWTTEAGVRRWRSSFTWRPLARRDAVRKPVYDRYYSINRHQPMPNGWIHWQDNTKMGLVDGKVQPVVQEYVLNSYVKNDAYDVKAADDYWAATKGYWAAVRGEWDRLAAKNGGIRVKEEAQTGTVIAGKLLELADEVQAGKTSEAAAVVAAKAAMGAAVK